MRLLRRAYTNQLRSTSRKRTNSSNNQLFPPPSGIPGGITFKKPTRKNATGNSGVVKQFHALTLDQRYRSVCRFVPQRVRPQKLTDESIDRFFKEADKDKDGLLNNHEFRAFIASRFSLRTIQANADIDVQTRPTNQQLKLVMIASAIPFVGFGFVDNIIMLAAGDMIEDHFHATYHLSMLCAAALGNTVADVVGLSLGGIIETFARRIGIPDPQLSKAQANMPITHWCNFVASAGGITFGCLLGMFPLLFMDHSAYEEDDKNNKLKKTNDVSTNHDCSCGRLDGKSVAIC